MFVDYFPVRFVIIDAVVCGWCVDEYMSNRLVNEENEDEKKGMRIRIERDDLSDGTSKHIHSYASSHI